MSPIASADLAAPALPPGRVDWLWTSAPDDGATVTPLLLDGSMSPIASADLAAPALRRGGWGGCGPVVARERGPGYAAVDSGGNTSGGDASGGDARVGSGSDRGGLGAALSSADCEAVGAALAGLPAKRLAGVLAAAMGRLDSEDAAAAVTAAARVVPAEAAVVLCGSLLAGWDSPGLLTIAEGAVTTLGRRTLSPGAVPDAQLHDSWERLHRLERRVISEKLRRLREITERGSYRTQGARSAIDLLVRHGLTYREAREQAETATALGELPQADKALAEGTIGPGQAAEAAKALHEANKARADAARRHAQARAEAAREEAARAEGAGDADAPAEGEARAGGGSDGAGGARDDAAARAAEQRTGEQRTAEGRAAEQRTAEERAAEERAAIDEAVAGAGPDVNRRQLRDRLEQDAAARSTDRGAGKQRRAYRNRHVRKFRDGDGETLRVHGPADAVATVWRMLQALAKTAGPDDERTPEQRRFDGLRHAADRYLREGALPDVAGHPAQVLLIASPPALHDLEGADPCTLDGCGPVPSATARMMCCDAQITVVITDDDGQPLRLGRTRYAPSRAQRRAVTARDRACIGCGADTTYCEVHHIRWWRNHGPTDIDNLVLICWNCHTHIHHHGWSIWRDPNGRYHAGLHPPPDARPVDGGAPGGGGPWPRPPNEPDGPTGGPPNKPPDGPPDGPSLGPSGGPSGRPSQGPSGRPSGGPSDGMPDPRPPEEPGGTPDGGAPRPPPPGGRPAGEMSDAPSATGEPADTRPPQGRPAGTMSDPRPSAARPTDTAGEPSLWGTDPPLAEPPPRRRTP